MSARVTTPSGSKVVAERPDITPEFTKATIAATQSAPVAPRSVNSWSVSSLSSMPTAAADRDRNNDICERVTVARGANSVADLPTVIP